ncbi:hypothetical protein N7468_003066 [Penicillium chermesinum]|uniref:Transcription factor hoxa13 n=1 Tax=Penicillium chermesinum TaxID=63820 RepID=A0A9W9TRH2_9EURO|nr:uncharacterized protein N7468_003066 [Penicillium chermesinum]KAJ5238447.1 hypothetical protein N7468_003066 [Penicillium chermesinum]
MSVKQENGHAEPLAKSNGSKSNGPRGRRQKKSGGLRWSFGLVVSLAGLTESSPRVCKPYLIARSHVEPHLTPYYDTYAAPYVDQARPYIETFNRQVYAPASKFAQTGYEKYGAPALEKAQAYGASQWNAQVTPRIQEAQDKAYRLYMAQVDPHVQKGVNAVSPYYEKASAAAFAVYWNHLVPFYTRSQPFIGKTYTAGQEILTTHVMPGARYTWSSAVYFANSSLWPRITGLYSEQVEPQLVKIGQRLASYREGKRLRAVVEDLDNTQSEQDVTPTSTTSEEAVHTTNLATVTSTEIPSPQPTPSAEELAQQSRERIDTDLERWQEKFAAVADKGVVDLEERLEEISVSAEKISAIKRRINELVETLPEEDAPEAEREAQEKLTADVRAAAVAVRDRAHSLRQWSLSFDEELLRRVASAVNSTLNILDNIRDLGLQEIGTRWAWSDGVTYKDWTRYHNLKAQLDDWRSEIEKVGINHKSVAEARDVATEILDEAMAVATDTAKELIRLKEVGYWKLAAREVSDNFDTRTEAPPPRPHAEPETHEENSQAVDEEESEHSTVSSSSDENSQADAIPDPDRIVSGESFDTEEQDDAVEAGTEDDDEPTSADPIEKDEAASVKRVFGGVAAAEIKSASAPIIDEEDEDTIHSLAKKAENAYSNVYDEASSAFADSTANAKFLYEIAKSHVQGQAAESTTPAHAQILSSIESAYSGAIKYATEQFDAKIAAVKATPTPSSVGPLAQISSIASSRLSEGLSAASEQLVSIQPIASETNAAAQQPFVLDAQRRYYEAIGLAHDHYSAFVSTASEAVYGTPTPTTTPFGIQDVLQGAESQYEHVSSLASASLAAVVASASSAISAADDGKAQRLIDDASSRYSAAISAASATLSIASVSASSAFYGTTPGPLESISSQASENWEALIAKASEQIYGTPAPYLERALDSSSEQFAAIRDVVSELLVGRQPSFTESVLSKLRVAYETPYPAEALSSASSYASEAYETASSVAASVISEVPSVKDIIANVNDQLSAAVEAASVGIYGTSKGPYEQATEAAAEAYSTASAQISGAVFGKDPSYLDVAKDAIEDIQSKASAAIYGEEPGAVESATSRLAAAVESAQSRLADLASTASSAASEAVETAASHVDDAASSVKSVVSSAKDEL